MEQISNREYEKYRHTEFDPFEKPSVDAVCPERFHVRHECPS